MKFTLVLGLLASIVLTQSLPAQADVGPTRFQKEYAKVVFDFAVDGGTVGAHPSIVTLPSGTAGLLVTNVLVYVNTPFTSSGSSSVGIGCAGTNDLFAYHDLTLVAADNYYAAALTGTAFGSGVSVLNFNAPALHSDNGKSVNTDCTITTTVDPNKNALTAGKLTAIIEYFRK